MASEITEHDQNASPSVHDDGNGTMGMENRGVKRARAAADDDDDDDDKPGRERRKIEIKFIQDKSRRHITFSKRKAGIMKKVRWCPSRAHRVVHLLPRRLKPLPAPSAPLTSTPGLRTVRPDGHASAAARRLRDWPRLHLHHTQAATASHQARGQEPHPGTLQPPTRLSHCLTNRAQACLNAPEPSSGDANGVDNDTVESPEDNHAQVPPGQPRGMPPNNQPMPQAYMTPEAALHYQSYLQQQQQSNQYPMAQQGMPRHPGGHYPQDQKLG